MQDVIPTALADRRICRRTETVAALVALETEELQGSFSEAAFTMLPWMKYTVNWYSTGTGPFSKELLVQDVKIISVEEAMRAPKRKDPA